MYVVFLQLFFVFIITIIALVLSIEHSILLSTHIIDLNKNVCFIIVGGGLVIVTIFIRNRSSSGGFVLIGVGVVVIAGCYCSVVTCYYYWTDWSNLQIDSMTQWDSALTYHPLYYYFVAITNTATNSSLYYFFISSSSSSTHHPNHTNAY